jgi:hypothetical protein
MDRTPTNGTNTTVDVATAGQLKINVATATTAVVGVSRFATNAESITGTATTVGSTPAGVRAGHRSRYRAINAQVGTTYTLVLADDDKIVTLTNAAAITVTVPLNSAVAFPVGTEIELIQRGAGQVTFAPSGAVVLNGRLGLKIAGIHGVVYLLKLATDTWILKGDTAA